MAPQLRHFITEQGFAKASAMGPVGLLLSIGSTNPRLAHEYFRAGVEGERGKVEKMLAEFVAICCKHLQHHIKFIRQKRELLGNPS